MSYYKHVKKEVKRENYSEFPCIKLCNDLQLWKRNWCGSLYCTCVFIYSWVMWELRVKYKTYPTIFSCSLSISWSTNTKLCGWPSCRLCWAERWSKYCARVPVIWVLQNKQPLENCVSSLSDFCCSIAHSCKQFIKSISVCTAVIVLECGHLE